MNERKMIMTTKRMLLALCLMMIGRFSSFRFGVHVCDEEKNELPINAKNNAHVPRSKKEEDARACVVDTKTTSLLFRNTT
jgi:hypothetical protein